MPDRVLTDHIIDGKCACLDIRVADEPGSGGANHRYEITGFDASGNPSHGPTEGTFKKVILFQNGPIGEAGGVNGIQNEDLLAILIDRMRGFQSGPYACRENALALTKLEEAMMWLQKRTRDRIARGVEGTHSK